MGQEEETTQDSLMLAFPFPTAPPQIVLEPLATVPAVLTTVGPTRSQPSEASSGDEPRASPTLPGPEDPAFGWRSQESQPTSWRLETLPDAKDAPSSRGTPGI